VALSALALVASAATAQEPRTAEDATDPANAPDQSEPGSHLRVWLVTAAPGDAVWERYGHNALRVLDTRTGRDVSYNWGIFDFQQVDFIPRFLQGRMLYMMAPFPTDAMVESYRRANREVRLQELSLTPAQKLRLRDFADDNALPQNRDYTYQYFLDNCSTRARDLLDLVLDGAIRDTYSATGRGATYRYHTRRLTQVDPLVFTGMDLALGAPTDSPISIWDEMFIPMVMADELSTFTVTGDDGSERPLVLSDEVVVPSTRAAEPEAPPGWLWIYLVIGVGLGTLFASAASERVREVRGLRLTVVGLATAWSLLTGVLGLILVGLLFTDHVFSLRNENLLLVNPLALGTAVLLPLSLAGERWSRRAGAWTAILAAIALVGFAWHLLPFSIQANGMHLAVWVPAHVGLAWGAQAGAMARTPATA
jgi:hypothetical protein